MGGDIDLCDRFPIRCVSIHAPAWGATAVEATSAYDKPFQSTPPHGGRLFLCWFAPPFLRFNPRPRMGGDIDPHNKYLTTFGFNPRPRMGGDIISGRKNPRCVRFNPRPRMGGDSRVRGSY